jgi:serine/threonine protein kinase
VLDGYGQADVPEKTVMKIGYYVASALEYMHKKGITHRDIKL